LQAYIAHKFNGQELEPGLKESAFYDPTNFTFPAGVHICEVEVDPETGVTTIASYVAVDDFGDIINPMIVEGQVHGGIAQGIGQALLEGASTTRTASSSPRATWTTPCRAPAICRRSRPASPRRLPVEPARHQGLRRGRRHRLAAAVINAMTDALGHEDVPMPATAQAVWRAAQKARPQQAAE
jgi:carbon-monoxide dehydrogenase large subunit